MGTPSLETLPDIRAKLKALIPPLGPACIAKPRVEIRNNFGHTVPLLAAKIQGYAARSCTES